MKGSKRTGLIWVLCLLAVAEALWVTLSPSAHRLRVVVAFGLVTPLAVATYFYVVRND